MSDLIIGAANDELFRDAPIKGAIAERCLIWRPTQQARTMRKSLWWRRRESDPRLELNPTPSYSHNLFSDPFLFTSSRATRRLEYHGFYPKVIFAET